MTNPNQPKRGVDEEIKNFNERFKETSWYPDNWEPIEAFIVQALSKARADERAKMLEKIEGMKKPLSDPVASWENEDVCYNQALSDLKQSLDETPSNTKQSS